MRTPDELRENVKRTLERTGSAYSLLIAGDPHPDSPFTANDKPLLETEEFEAREGTPSASVECWFFEKDDGT